jgi:pyruvate/2-oxoglutarate dehydrogenase complex dihydrolipoamide dehydrogenase (E3) component
MIVLGAGAIGVELAQAFARLGTRVTVIEALDRLIAREEPEASAVVHDALVDDGVDVRVATKAVSFDATPDRVRLCIDPGGGIEAEHLLVAVGREPGTRNIGLDVAGVRTDDHGFVHTDDTLATSAPGVWAIGDVTGRLQFTHAAARMAFVAVHNALDRSARLRARRFDTSAIPWVTFTSPQIGRVGVTEADAASIQGARVAYLPLDELDRAVAEHATRGFVKLIAGPRAVLRDVGGGRILGATIAAPTGGELVGEVALAMHTHAFTGRLAQAVHAYPTWSGALQQTATQFFFTYGGRRARPPRQR